MSENQVENVAPFDFRGKPIRMILVDKEPHFLGKDVSDALGYKHGMHYPERVPIWRKPGNKKHGSYISLRNMPDLVSRSTGEYGKAGRELVASLKRQFSSWFNEEFLPGQHQVARRSPIEEQRQIIQLQREILDIQEERLNLTEKEYARRDKLRELQDSVDGLPQLTSVSDG